METRSPEQIALDNEAKLEQVAFEAARREQMAADKKALIDVYRARRERSAQQV